MDVLKNLKSLHYSIFNGKWVLMTICLFHHKMVSTFLDHLGIKIYLFQNKSVLASHWRLFGHFTQQQIDTLVSFGLFILWLIKMAEMNALLSQNACGSDLMKKLWTIFHSKQPELNKPQQYLWTKWSTLVQAAPVSNWLENYS